MENQPSREVLKEVVVRKAAIEDLEKIQRLNQELCLKENHEYDSDINPDYPTTKAAEEYFRSRIEEPNSFTIIAEEDGAPVGYLVGTLLEPEDYRTIKKLAEAENMFVKEECRGKGIGRKLTKQFEVWCKEKGVEVIRYVASAGNIDAIKFYEGQGLRKVSVVLEKKITTE